ncbi:MAG: DNA primase, partial [Nitrososphaerota archaeon]|nr:DNA primase [Nitrososphaerota archaeon]
ISEINKQQSTTQPPQQPQTQPANQQQQQQQRKQQPPTPQPERAPPRPQKPPVPEQIKEIVKSLQGTLESVLLNDKLEQIERLPVSQLAEKLQQIEGVNSVIFDGIITQRIVDIAVGKTIKRIIASRVSEAVKPNTNVELLTFQETLR